MAGDDTSDRHGRWTSEPQARRAGRRRLRQRLDEAISTRPVAHALVLAAADWRDAGCGMAVPLPRLQAQAARRLARVRPDLPLSDLEVEQALAWALSEPALLSREETRGGRTGYRLSGDLWPHHTRHRLDDLPAEAVLAVATPLETVALGVRALFLRETPDRELATRAWWHAVSSDDHDAVALAMWHLADLARDDGDMVAARDAYVQVIDSEHFDAAPRALLDLAQLELDRGDEEAARPLLHAAVASGHSCVVAPAAGLLASLCLRADDSAGAVEAFRLAADADDPLHSPYYGLLLGRMLMLQDDLDGARHAFQQVIDADHPMYWAEAVAELALMLGRRGNIDGARRVLLQVIDTDDPLAVPELVVALAEVQLMAHDLDEAEVLLGRLREYPLGLEPKVEAQVDFLAARIEVGRGNEAGAARLFGSLFDSDDPERREWARVLALAFAHHLRGSGVCTVPGTEPLLRYLMGCEDREVAAWAAYGLGRIAAQRRHWAAAREAYRRAAGLNGAGFSGRVALRLADILADEGDTDEAVDAYLMLVEAGPPEVTAEATTAIGRLSGGLGADRGPVLNRLRDACWKRVADGGPHLAEIAFALGRIELDVIGNPYGAVNAWDVAAAVDDETLRPFVWYNLGIAYAKRHAPVSAAQAFQRAFDTGHPSVAPLAALGLGRQAERHHDLPAAFDAYRCALAGALDAPDETHPAAWIEAAYALGRLTHSCQPDDAEIAYYGVIESIGDGADVSPGIAGAAYAHLGRLYAEQGNRVLAERVWRQGRRHPDRKVAAAFAAERRSIGRIRIPIPRTPVPLPHPRA